MASPDFHRRLDELMQRAKRLGVINTLTPMTKEELENALLKTTEEELLNAISKLLDSAESVPDDFLRFFK